MPAKNKSSKLNLFSKFLIAINAQSMNMMRSGELVTNQWLGHKQDGFDQGEGC